MEPDKEMLYDAFGSLLYAICMVDGQVQEAEAKKIEQLLKNHEAAAEMEWSFTYDFENHITTEQACEQALAICKAYGQAPDYPFLFDALRQVAASSQGLSTAERQRIESLEGELKMYFFNQAANDQA